MTSFDLSFENRKRDRSLTGLEFVEECDADDLRRILACGMESEEWEKTAAWRGVTGVAGEAEFINKLLSNMVGGDLVVRYR